ncbi:unnamed protein product [Parajaminaea phylloscopi]
MTERTVPSSEQASRRYFTVDADTGIIKFKPEAFLVQGAPCLGNVVCNVLNIRDITDAVCADRKTEIKDIRLIYGPDTWAAVTALVPIGDLILEHHPSIGEARMRRVQGGSREFTTGYGVTYFSVGIQAEVFRLLWNLININLRPDSCDWEGAEPGRDITQLGSESAFDVPKLQYHHGMYWMYAKVNSSLKGVVTGDDGKPRAVDVADLIKELKSNVKADAVVSLRLKRGANGRNGGEDPWELAMTISTVAIIDVTTVSSPAVNAVEVHSRGLSSTQTIIDAMDRCCIHEWNVDI